MNKNMGELDTLLRAAVVAPAAAVAAVVVGTFSVLGLALLVLATVMLITAASGFCPAYRLLGVDKKRFGIHTTRARVSP